MKKPSRSQTKTFKSAQSSPDQDEAVRNFLLSPPFHLLLVILVGAAVYANTFDVPFVLDDVTSVYGNPLVLNFRPVFVPRILGILSFALNYHWSGTEVRSYHLVNLAIHLANGALVYALSWLILKTPFVRGTATGRHDNRLLPLFVALLFVCHPVQTQAVTYISQRVASLATLFYLGTHVAWLGARQATPKGLRLALAGVTLGSALLALATKEIAFTLPLTLLLVELVFFEGGRRRFMLPLALFFLAAMLVPLAFARGAGGMATHLWRLVTPTTVVSRGDYLLTQFRVQLTYLRLLFFPAGQNLDYDYPVYHSLFSPPVLGSAIVIVSLFIGSVYLLVRARRGGNADLLLMAFGVLWFFITLSVESSVIPLQDLIFEHRLYLPSVGFFTALVTALLTGARHLAHRHSRAAVFIVPSFAMVVIVLAVAAVARNEIWRDEVTLWEDIAAKSPGKVRAHGSLGTAYLGREQYDAAARQYEIAIRLDPRDPANHNNLGTAYLRLKKWADAARAFQETLRLEPGNVKAHYNLGMALTEQGMFREAERELREATRLRPDYDQAHNNLGIVYARQNRYADALAEFKEASRLNPGNDQAVKNYNALRAAVK